MFKKKNYYSLPSSVILKKKKKEEIFVKHKQYTEVYFCLFSGIVFSI